MKAYGLGAGHLAIIAYPALGMGFGLTTLTLLLEGFTFPVDNPFSSSLGYPSFLILVFGIVFALYSSAHALLRAAWEDRRTRFVSLASGLAYGVFFSFLSNMVTFPDSSELELIPRQMAHSGFVALLQAYGPYSYWPILEVWSPSTGVFAAVSVGTGILVVLLSALLVYSTSLLALNLKNRKAIVAGSGVGPLAGSFAVTAFSNACGCCASLLLPVVAALLGVSAGGTIFQLVNGSPVMFDVLVTGNLAVLTLGILLSAKRLGSCVLG